MTSAKAGRKDLRDPVLRFFGAARGVTGSCFAIETSDTFVLIDCGLFQGSKTEKQLNYREFPFDVASVDAVILTHAHIDHSGLLPKLTKRGFAGPIYATPATVDLCSVMLPDAGHIQEVEVDQRNRRYRQRGEEEVEPIYTADDAYPMLHRFHAVECERWQSVVPGVRFRFWNAGHLLGSASIEMEVGPDNPIRILFSGDIGPDNKLFQAGPVAPKHWDYVVCESTYADKDRVDATIEGRRQLLGREVRAASRHENGALIIPSFAVERTQELMTDLILLMQQSEIKTVPIYIDSPLATRASEIFQKHRHDFNLGVALDRAMHAKNVHFTESVEQSKALDRVRGFHIVIAASGMCEAGRIRHRLKNWLWREEATVLFVGYQAAGTLGRLLAGGTTPVKIQGEEITVRAQIRQIDAYSGHADGPELERWLRSRLPISHGIFLVHGEEAALTAMRQRAADCTPATPVFVPFIDSAFTLNDGGPTDISVSMPSPRIDPLTIGHRDWNNDYQVLLQDINEAVRAAADDRSRAILLRKFRRVLQDER
jgi:metallo-beta-lactamase family protein